MAITNCTLCGKQIKMALSTFMRKKNHFCNQECYSLYQRSHPSNTGRTWKKKDCIPSNKGAFIEDAKHPRPYIYRRIIFEESNIQLCNRCPKRAKLVHHKDRNQHNNLIENLEPLCYSCHAIEHDSKKHLPPNGGWNERRRIKNVCPHAGRSE
jgi:hypothetical protein